MQEDQEEPPIIWQVFVPSDDDDEFEKATVSDDEECGKAVIEW